MREIEREGGSEGRREGGRISERDFFALQQPSTNQIVAVAVCGSVMGEECDDGTQSDVLFLFDCYG